MNTRRLFGAALVIYGVATLVLRHTHPHWFRKLGPMKQRWGPRLGDALHLVGYSFVPLVLGASMVLRGLQASP